MRLSVGMYKERKEKDFILIPNQTVFLSKDEKLYFLLNH